MGARSRPRGVGSPHWRVPGGYSEPRKMVRECFFEIPGSQIQIFTKVLTYRLCKFDLALGGSWALLGGFRAALGAPRCALGAPGGSREKGFGPRRAPGGAQNVKNMILGPLSFYPKRSGAYKYSGFSVFQKKRFFSNSVLQILRGGQGGSQDVRWAP